MQSSSHLPSRLKQNLPELALGGLLLFLYGPLLIHWADGWLNKNISTEHEYFSHGLLGIPFAAYLVWTRRDRWSALPTPSLQPFNLLGLGLILLGVACYLCNLIDLINLSLTLTLVGICLWLKGVSGLRLQTFPLLLLLLSTPNELPYLIAPYTLPLQKLIAGTAGFILLQFGMDIRVDQIYLFVNDQVVEVAPYCAGLKMLFTSFYVGLLLLYWTGTWTSRPKTITFCIGILIISTIANIIRNTLLTFFHGTGQDQAFTWLHDSWGGDLYSTLMLGLIVLLLRGLDQWLPDEFESNLDSEDQLEPQN